MDKPTKEKWSEWHGLLDAAANDCIGRNPNSIQQASDDMVTKVRGDPRLREAMLEVLVTEACHDRIRRQLQLANQAAWHDADALYDRSQRSDRLKRATQTSQYYRLMDFTLRGGVRLGDATYKQVKDWSDFQSKQATRMGQTASWLGLVAAEMDPTKKKQTVKDVLTEEKLRTLQEVAIKGLEPEEIAEIVAGR